MYESMPDLEPEVSLQPELSEGIKGKAYAFFDCRYPFEHIEATLPDMKDLAQVVLELELRRGVAVDEEDLRALMKSLPPSKGNFGYTLVGRQANLTNEQAANEMKDLMVALASGHSSLYEPAEPRRIEIVYHDGREWSALSDEKNPRG